MSKRLRFVRDASRLDERNVFDKDPRTDQQVLRSNYLHPTRGLHFYFRNMLLPMQQRFSELTDHSEMPAVFLHGSPHLDNYSRSEVGVAMVDFDRSRYGPYAWDLVRVLTSVAFRQKRPAEGFLPAKVSRALFAGYRRGLKRPEEGFREMTALATQKMPAKPRTTKRYLRHNGKWAHELRCNLLPDDHEDARAVLRGYVANRGRDLAEDGYALTAMGSAIGSMGRRRFLYVLSPTKPKLDWLLLEIKRVREDPDTRWYRNPFAHHGERMIAAVELYAPGWERWQGYTTYHGLQYWGHQIPAYNGKLKRDLTAKESADFLDAVGNQLGRAHRLSTDAETAEHIRGHLSRAGGELLEAADAMKAEITEAFGRYIAALSFG